MGLNPQHEPLVHSALYCALRGLPVPSPKSHSLSVCQPPLQELFWQQDELPSWNEKKSEEALLLTYEGLKQESQVTQIIWPGSP